MKKLSLAFFVLLFLQNGASALETDQFIAGNVILKDASDVMNQYFYDNMEKAFHWANRKNASKISCQDVALKVMDSATGKFTLSQASTFASETKFIERFPEDSVSERGYINESFYEHAWLPLQVVDLARTININNIYVGTDKFGHFSHMGLRYYKSYLKLKKKGLSEEEAIKKAIVDGFGSEYGILGYGIDGVLSYADLEANYQGLMFSLDMCRGERPYLKLVDNRWSENPDHKFDVRDYFTPKMDESYNFSFWRKPLYKMVRKKLIAEYCTVKNDPVFVERMKYYDSINKRNLNDELIEEKITSQKRFNRSKEDLSNLCP